MLEIIISKTRQFPRSCKLLSDVGFARCGGIREALFIALCRLVNPANKRLPLAMWYSDEAFLNFQRDPECIRLRNIFLRALLPILIFSSETILYSFCYRCAKLRRDFVCEVAITISKMFLVVYEVTNSSNFNFIAEEFYTF